MNRAVAAARASFDDGRWRRLAPIERERKLRRLADLIEENRTALGDLDTLDAGILHGYAGFIVDFAVGGVNYYAGWPTKLRGSIPEVADGLNVVVSREPIGVVAIIVPWNGPTAVIAFVAAALAAGNSVVLKPAPQTPLSAHVLGRLCIEAGIPDGVVNVLQGGGAAGSGLVTHPDVDKISFTGSVRTGKAIAASAAAQLKKVSLELGGKSPFIVFEDADIEAAAAGAMSAVWSNSGQVCTAGTRTLVHRSVYDSFVDAVVTASKDLRVGSAFDEKTEMGPLISAEQRDVVERYVGIGVGRGRQPRPRRLAGRRRGLSARAHDLHRRTRDMRIAQEEIFGPVMALFPFDDEAEAYALANDVEFGLAAGVWTKDLDRAHRATRAIHAGTVWVNSFQLADAGVPYGGVKQSGYGRVLGEEGLNDFLNTKSVWTKFNNAELIQRPTESTQESEVDEATVQRMVDRLDIQDTLTQVRHDDRRRRLRRARGRASPMTPARATGWRTSGSRAATPSSRGSRTRPLTWTGSTTWSRSTAWTSRGTGNGADVPAVAPDRHRGAQRDPDDDQQVPQHTAPQRRRVEDLRARPRGRLVRGAQQRQGEGVLGMTTARGRVNTPAAGGPARHPGHDDDVRRCGRRQGLRSSARVFRRRRPARYGAESDVARRRRRDRRVARGTQFAPPRLGPPPGLGLRRGHRGGPGDRADVPAVAPDRERRPQRDPQHDLQVPQHPAPQRRTVADLRARPRDRLVRGSAATSRRRSLGVTTTDENQNQTTEAAARGCPVVHFDFTELRPALSYFTKLDELREEAPIAWNTYGGGFWMLNRNALVQEAFQTPEVFSSSATVPTIPEPDYHWIPTMENAAGPSPLSVGAQPAVLAQGGGVAGAADPPGLHRPASTKLEEPRARSTSSRTSRWSSRPRCSCRSSTCPAEDTDDFVGWVEDVFGGLGNPAGEAAMNAAFESIRLYFTALMEDRRANPRPPEGDFFGRLLNSNIGDRPIRDDEFLNMSLVLLLGGLDTVKSQLGYMFYHLATHDADRQRIIDDPEIAPAAVEEFLRAYAIVMDGRKLAQDIDFHGCPMKEGDMVMLTLAAASRDTTEFDHADQVDFDREAVTHFSFASGPHRCLGSHLARLELKVALQEWHKRIPHYQLDPMRGPEQIVESGPQLGLSALPLVMGGLR